MLQVIFIVMCCALLLWYIAPIFKGILNFGNTIGIIFSALLTVFAACFYETSRGLKIFVLIFLSLIFLVIILPHVFNTLRYANYKNTEKPNTVIVLGCRVKGRKPSKFLYDRCKKAAEYLKSDPDAIALLSGGKGKGEDISEAMCMKNTLISLGIAEDKLILEDKSKSTAENIEFSERIINEKNFPRDVLIITNEFHEYRAKIICDKNKLNFHSLSSSTSFAAFLTYFTREIFAVFKAVCQH